MERRIILSRIQTPDDTILTSHHKHDYVTHIDKNGEKYILDGGRDYQKVAITKEPFKDLTVYSDAPFEIIRESLYRGTTGKDGKQPLKWILLKDMSNDHIEALIGYLKESNESFYINFYINAK